MFLTKYCF